MFEVVIERQAAKALLAFDPSVRLPIAEAVYALSMRFMKGKRLHGSLNGCRSVRCGAYRILYEVDVARSLVRVLRIGHRKDVYKKP